MQVLEHNQRRRGVLLELAQQRTGHRVWLCTLVDQPAELPFAGLGKVDERAERSWREQRLAGSPQDLHAGPAAITELAHERGLSHAGLATDERDHASPAEGDLLQALLEPAQLAIALQESADVRARGG